MRILLIEDHDDIADAICFKLEREGHQVVVVHNGRDGIMDALTGAFDVIVLDINLPLADGFTVLSTIRARGIVAPVLIITARNQVADKVSLLDLGADDYIVKPLDVAELAARVRALGRRAMGLARPVLELGAMRLDLAGRTAWLGERPLELGRREFDLLEMLATAMPDVQNKDHLVVRLFGHDDTGSPNAVELLVSRLRRKLAGCGIQIETQRGVGYFLQVSTP